MAMASNWSACARLFWVSRTLYVAYRDTLLLDLLLNQPGFVLYRVHLVF